MQKIKNECPQCGGSLNTGSVICESCGLIINKYEIMFKKIYDTAINNYKDGNFLEAKNNFLYLSKKFPNKKYLCKEIISIIKSIEKLKKEQHLKYRINKHCDHFKNNWGKYLILSFFVFLFIYEFFMICPKYNGGYDSEYGLLEFIFVYLAIFGCFGILTKLISCIQIKNKNKNKDKLLIISGLKAIEIYNLGLEKYLHGFAEKHHDIEYSDNDLIKLSKLLCGNGIKISKHEVAIIISGEIDKYKYNKFRKILLDNKVTNKKECLRFCAQSYGENLTKLTLRYITRFLGETGIIISNSNFLKLYLEEVENIKNDHYSETLLSKNKISINDVDILDGYAFEGFLSGLFEKMGYSVTQTSLSGDQGADLIIEKLANKIVVQAKRYSVPVGNKAVQEAVASMRHYGANEAMVVTNSSFTKSAIELARSNNVELVDRHKLSFYLSSYYS